MYVSLAQGITNSFLTIFLVGHHHTFFCHGAHDRTIFLTIWLTYTVIVSRPLGSSERLGDVPADDTGGEYVYMYIYTHALSLAGLGVHVSSLSASMNAIILAQVNLNQNSIHCFFFLGLGKG